MSSPNEPGYPRTGEKPGGANGSATGASGSGHAADSSDIPPWQRGPRPRPQQPGEGQGGLDARLNRFISGGAQDTEQGAPRGERTESLRPESRSDNRPEPTRPEASRSEQSRAEQARQESRSELSRPDQPRQDGPRPDQPRQDQSRQDGPRSEKRPDQGAAYASELPDLSGPAPRPQPQRRPTERSAEPTKTTAKSAPARGMQVGQRQHKGPVRASMQIRRVDPWSALKVSLVLSVALFFVWMIAVAFLYLVLGGMGVWTKLNSNVGDLLTSASGSSGGELVSSGTIFGGAALIGLINIVLLTAAATIAAFIYNLTTDLVGGVEVTLADRD